METGMVILEGKNLSKRFSGIQALDNVDVTLKQGTITALIGENGAGKSTLVRILSGYHKPDSGILFIDNKDTPIDSVDAAQQVGINVIHQVPQFALDLSVIDNIFLGKELAVHNSFRGMSRYRKKEQADIIRPYLDQYDADIDPNSKLKYLKAFQRRLVGIIKALVNSARILIMDEPTAALPLGEREKLLANILKLKADGYAVMYVSHILDEIEQIADEVIALRDGKLAGYEKSKPTARVMIEMMTGHSISSMENFYDDAVRTPKNTAHPPNGGDYYRFTLNPPADLEESCVIRSSMEFRFGKGEIVVLTGIVGAGIKTAAEAAYGALKKWKTEFKKGSDYCIIRRPRDAINAGIGYLSDDRRRESVIPDFTIRRNTTLPALRKIAGFLTRILEKKEKAIVTDLFEKLKVKRSGLEQFILELSGGNQQKVMIARWLFTEVEFLILNEPTQGIDIMTKQEVVRLLKEFSSQGGTCLIVTNDPEEFLRAADGVLVMRKGKQVAAYQRGAIHKSEIIQAMLIQD